MKLSSSECFFPISSLASDRSKSRQEIEGFVIPSETLGGIRSFHSQLNQSLDPIPVLAEVA